MKARTLTPRVDLIGAVDWNRRLFDALIPLPDGTSYNGYLVKGSQKTALLDSVDPSKASVLKEQLASVKKIDYLIAHHAEQDHAGMIPWVLEKFPEATLICTPKAKGMLLDLLDFPSERVQTVSDGETISLGDLNLEFIYTPWVHWPETMVTYLREEKILFSCDFFGSHLATSDTFVTDEVHTLRSAKRYYAEIMMPFRIPIQKNLERLAPYDIKMIAPSHGPVYDKPSLIIDAYKDWVSAPPKNKVVLPYITMHESTGMLVERMVSALTARGIHVQPFDLTVADIGEIAMELVDSATIVLGTPILLGGAHPTAAYAASLASALKPKTMFAAFLVSYGWGPGAIERLPELIAGLKVEAIPGVYVRGMPRQADLEAVDKLAEVIHQKHRDAGLV